MSLTPKEKELISIGGSVASGCKLCTTYHFKKVRKAGASDDEIGSLSAAFVVNCTSSMERHLAAARRLGVGEDEIGSAPRISKFTKAEADSLCCRLI